MNTDITNGEDFDAMTFFRDAVEQIPEVVSEPTIRPMIKRKLALRLRPPKCNVVDFDTMGFLEPAVAELRSEFEGWKAALKRTNESLWLVLGAIYELSPKILENESERTNLVAEAKKVEEVQASTNWRPDTKQPCELLLVILFGSLSEKKSQRSQWLSSLKAAEQAGIKRSKSDFVDWISIVGGVSGARKLIARPRPQRSASQIDDILASIHIYDDDQMELPMRMWGKKNINGLSLMLVKQCTGNIVAPVFSLADERQIIAVWEAFEKQGRRIERKCIKDYKEYEAGLRRIQSERRKMVRDLYRKKGGQRKTRMEFEEFLEEWETENLFAPEEFETRITEPR